MVPEPDKECEKRCDFFFYPKLLLIPGACVNYAGK